MDRSNGTWIFLIPKDFKWTAWSNAVSVAGGDYTDLRVQHYRTDRRVELPNTETGLKLAVMLAEDLEEKEVTYKVVGRGILFDGGTRKREDLPRTTDLVMLAGVRDYCLKHGKHFAHPNPKNRVWKWKAQADAWDRCLEAQLKTETLRRQLVEAELDLAEALEGLNGLVD